MRRRRKLKRPLVLIVILLLVLASGTAVLFSLNRYPKELLTVENEDKNFGSSELVKEKNKNLIKVYHFPKTKISSINTWIDEEMKVNDVLVQKELQEDHKTMVKQDYSSEEINDFASIKIQLYIDDELVREKVKSFDTVENTDITANRLFTNAGKNIVTHKLRDEFSQANMTRHEFLDTYNIKNFKDFYIHKNQIEFYAHDKSFLLPLEETTHYLQEDLGNYQRTDGFVPSVYMDQGVDPKEKLLAFTFDDGPHSEITPKLMNTLEKYGGQGTFFIVGSRVEENEDHKDILKSILDRGHQLANHSYDHSNFNTLSVEALNAQIDRTNTIFEEATGYVGPYMVRPPYGNANTFVKENTQSVFVNWNLDTLDWLTRDAKLICDEIIQTSEDGDIILMHDLYEESYKGFSCGIEHLAKQGYTFVTVEELFKARGVDYKPGIIYYNAPKRNE